MRRSWGSRDLVGVGIGSMSSPRSGLPFQLEQHDPCMISEEKEFCCCPHNPVKSENHWPNPIHLISHTMWKLRPGDRVSQHPPGKAAAACACLLAHYPFTPGLAWALPKKKKAHPTFPTFWLVLEKGWGAPQLGTIPPPHLLPICAVTGQSSPAHVSFSQAKAFLSN